MSETSQIIRIAAKGDGVTADGQHVSGSLPGDQIADGKIVKRGARHVDPPCKHFGRCGGCQLQHADEQALEQFVRDRVVNAATGQGIKPEELLDTHLSPPAARRRATLHALRTAKGAVVGFKQAGSHTIVDLVECPVIHPDLATLIKPLRAFVGAHGSKRVVDAALTLSDSGVDVALRNLSLEGLAATEAALDFARDNNLARLSIDQGYGPETVWEPQPVQVTLGGVPVGLPSGAFLQATQDAETRMVDDACQFLEGSGVIADLFSGLGTFAFALAKGRKVLAAEADQAAHLACKSAAGRNGAAVHALHRDLFRNPLMEDELNRFEGLVLDPPRAGARDQIGRIAASKVPKVVYISCNPSSWARDAAKLVEGGYRLTKLRPVGQFRWSTHVELVSLFEK